MNEKLLEVDLKILRDLYDLRFSATLLAFSYKNVDLFDALRKFDDLQVRGCIENMLFDNRELFKHATARSGVVIGTTAATQLMLELAELRDAEQRLNMFLTLIAILFERIEQAKLTEFLKGVPTDDLMAAIGQLELLEKQPRGRGDNSGG